MKDIQRDILDKITPEIRKEMESIWFTADLHAEHPKIVNICNRPVYHDKQFVADLIKRRSEDSEIDMEEWDMYVDKEYLAHINPKNNEWLIKEVINSVVNKNDDLYILGDVTMANRIISDKFLDRLNGNKRLITGNHDKNIRKSTRFCEITQIKNFTFSRANLNIHIILCHYPMLSWERRIHGAWHLYGHVHGRNPGIGRSHDVGIDNLDNLWRPRNLYEICQIMSHKPLWDELDKHLNPYEVTNPKAGTEI